MSKAVDFGFKDWDIPNYGWSAKVHYSEALPKGTADKFTQRLMIMTY